MKLKRSDRRGFTLIELLVVIAIISLLASIVLASLNSARVKARDARRIADLNQIRTALNFYYDSTNAYPSVGGWVSSRDAQPWLPGISPAYISSVPVDPTNTTCDAALGGSGPWAGGTNYCYVYGYPQDGFPQKYDLITLLEDPANPQRCGVKGWLYHTGGEVSWCGIGYSPYLYADH